MNEIPRISFKKLKDNNLDAFRGKNCRLNIRLGIGGVVNPVGMQ